MSDEAYNPVEHIDWELVDKDHTFEWLVHLCEVFNRNEETDDWAIWPEDFLWHPHQISIPEEHRQMWLNVIFLIFNKHEITISGNKISVIGKFGSEFKFEMMPDLSDWVGIEHPQGANCIPEEMGLDDGDYIPDGFELCWDCPEGIPTPVGLYSLIIALLDETKAWDYLLSWHFVECWICRENRPMQRQEFERVGWMYSDEESSAIPAYSRILGSLDKRPRAPGPYYCCWWCGPNAPDHH